MTEKTIKNKQANQVQRTHVAGSITSQTRTKNCLELSILSLLGQEIQLTEIL